MAVPASIVLTRSTALRLFGDVHVLGKTLTLDQRTELVVGAIIEDQPRQSHLSFDFLLALPDRWKDCWRLECGHSYTYVKLRPGADVEKVEAAIQRLVETH
jgi:putative ABC transport system permease protein